MIIEEHDYRLIQVSDSSTFWDLELLHVIKPKGKEPRKEFKNEGYGMSIEHAIKRIINFRIHNKYSEEVIQMKDYLKEYKDQINKLEKLFDIYENG